MDTQVRKLSLGERLKIVINSGVKVYDDSLRELVSQYTKERYVKFIFKKLPKKEMLKPYGKIVEVNKNYYTLKLDSKEMPAVIAKVTSKYKLFDIDILSVPLDDVITDIFNSTK